LFQGKSVQTGQLNTLQELIGALLGGAPERANTGFKFLKGIRKEGIHSFQIHDELMNLHGPKNR